jgi:hypothetical protein
VLFNGLDAEEMPGVEFGDLPVEEFAGMSTDFISTFKSTRFPGNFSLDYDPRSHKLMVSYYLKEGTATAANTYNVKCFRLSYDFSDGQWYKQYLGGSRIVLSPYTSIEYPCLQFTDAVNEPSQHIYIFNDRPVTPFLSNGRNIALSTSAIVEDSFTGTLTDKASQIIMRPGYFVFEEPHYFGHLNAVELELYGTGIANVTVELNSWDDLTRNTIKTETFTRTFDLSSDEPVLLRIGRRVKHFELKVSINPTTTQYDVEIHNILVHFVANYKHVQS